MKMFRRQFVQIFAALGAGSVALSAADGKVTKSVTYTVKGFSCVTCAVGLDTMLQKQRGVARCKSTYPEGIVKIEFHPEEITEEAIQGYIREMGFTVEKTSTL
jgi:copper chaperone CopZ